MCKCDNGKLARCVLVEGAPGVGKTTFAFELCKQWARGEILQECGVVVIVKLRDQRSRTAQTIDDLLYHPNPKFRQAVTELVEQDGEGMLLILDGYDELTTKQRKSGSVIQWLMRKKLLYQATLMVTSRPLATRTLHPDFLNSIEQHIEVLGFTEGDIKAFINSACGDNPELVEDFQEYLSCHPFSSSLMFNPLQCAIVTDIYCSYWRNGDKGFAPKTLTELYTGLVHTLLLRYLTHHPVHKDRDWRLRDMNDLPEDVKQQIKAVTALAAKGIEKQQYVFDEEDDNVPSETLGLMQREEELTAGIGRSLSHNFLHLTLQEYLAAVHYSQQCDNDEEQLSHILGQMGHFPLNNFLQYYGKKREKSSSSSATHWPAVLFLAGRTQLSGIDPDLLKAGLHYTSVDVPLLHLLYETQCPQLIQSTLVTSRKYISVSGRSALDWFVIGYCVSNSTRTWRVEKKATVNPEYFNHLVMGLKLAPQDGSGEGKIVSLDLCGLWPEILMIFSWLIPFTKNVSSIRIDVPKQNLHKLKLEEPMVEDVFDSYPLLEELMIEGYMYDHFEIKFPCIPQQSNIHTLSLRHCNLSSESTSSLIHFLQSPNSRLLHKLYFSNCTFSTSDHTYKFSSFELLETNGKYSLKAEGSSFAINHWLLYIPSYANQMTELILNITEKDSSPDETLEGISLNNLHTLSLTKCQLRNETTSSLIHSLQSQHCKLHKLALRKYTFPSIDEFSLYVVQNSKLSLSATGSCSGINHWLSILSSYSVQLTELILSITEQETDETLDWISSNNLLTLSLTKCKLNNEATSLLIHFLQSPNSRLLHKLSFSDCTFSTADHTYCFTVFELLESNDKYSLKAKGSSFAINHWLLYIPSYANLMTELILNVTEQDSSPDETLEGISLNNLHILSLTKCQLRNETACSLIHSLQSPNSRLLSFQDCTFCTADHTYCFTVFELLESNNKNSLKAKGSSFAINHWLLYIPSYANLMTELNLDVTEQDSSPDETLEGISLNNLHTLSLTKCQLSIKTTSSVIHSLQSKHCKLNKLTLQNCTIPSSDCCDINRWLSLFSSYSVQLTELILSITEQETDQTLDWISSNNLHTLSLTKCELNNEETSSLIHFLQSPNSRILHKLSFSDCKLSTTDHTYQFSYFELLESNGKYSLNAKGSSFAINHWLLYIPSYANLMTELILNVTEQDSSPDETLEGISLNNLHTLSLTKCQLRKETTSSLIHSLQSQHCKLHKLALRKCAFPCIDEFSFYEVPNGKFSLSATGSCSAINHWLSLISSHSFQLTELILSITEQETDETLEGITLNNLHTLSLTKCQLRNETTSSLIHSLQSQHCKLHKLALRKCAFPSIDEFSFYELQNGKFSLSATGSCSAINHWLSLISSHSVQLTELILSITKQEADETLEGIGLFSHMLEILYINNNNTTCFSFSIPLFFELRQYNLHTLSLTKCELNHEATSSLIHFLQSPNSRLLQKLSFTDCKLSTTDHTYQFSSFELLESNGKYSLNAKGSSFAVNHWLLYIPSYANLMTELILNVTEQDSSPDETLEGISLNNLHTLSLTKCELNHEATSSLIHFLQSPNSRLLQKLSFTDCKLSTTDHTYQFSSFELLESKGKYSLNAKGSSFAINHWLLYIPSYANLMTELILNVTEQDSSPDETLEGISLNNLHTLSLTKCQLCIKTTSSLIHSLQSKHCKLNKLTLTNCTIPSTDCCDINRWLSLFSSYSVQLTELILSITEQETDETLDWISSNNLHTLSLAKCELNNEATSSLIHFLQSPNSRPLDNLSFRDCTFSTADHTYCFTVFELLETNGIYSLKAEGSSFAEESLVLYTYKI